MIKIVMITIIIIIIMSLAFLFKVPTQQWSITEITQTDMHKAQ